MKYDFTLPVLELNDIGEYEVTPWALTVKEFRGIYDADKRKDKKKAIAVMLYVAICEDYSLWGLKLPNHKLLEYARRHCGIDNIEKGWEVHNGIRTARERYRELQGYVCTEMQMLFAAEKSIQSLTRLIVRITSDADKVIEKSQLDGGSVEETKELIDDLLKKTDKLSDRLDTLRKLQDKISALRREEKMAKIRGGGTAGPKERPEDSLIAKQRNA